MLDPSNLVAALLVGKPFTVEADSVLLPRLNITQSKEKLVQLSRVLQSADSSSLETLT